MNDFHIKLQSLVHGWATIKFEDSEREQVQMVSHILDDSLSNLVYSALAAIQGEIYRTEFYLEPEFICYEVTPHDGEIYVSIGTTRFSCSLKRYVRQILKLFDAYLHFHSTEEYEAQWHHEYPINTIEQLRYQLRKMP